VTRAKHWSIEQLGLQPGDRSLDVGCGTGEDVAAMAGLVGPLGWAVGIDQSRVMITEASRRHGQQTRATFAVADAQRLPFGSATFGACRMERTLQHLADPAATVGEIARVLSVGGRVAVVEPDWETMVIEGSDPEVSSRIWASHLTLHPQPLVGRQLRGLLTSNGFVEVELEAMVAIITTLDHAKSGFGLERAAQGAVDRGVVSPREAKAWMTDLEDANQDGRFFSAATMFCAAGTRS
jgi:SAM-dependent methyltransferase